MALVIYYVIWSERNKKKCKKINDLFANQELQIYFIGQFYWTTQELQ